MVKIALLSDTHSYLDNAILKHIDTCDEVWHAGDIGVSKVTDILKSHKPLRAVYGNIDGHELRAEFPMDLVFNCNGLNVFITHIGGYPTRYPAIIKQKIREHKPDLFICGHSHILKVMPDKELNHLHINPGAAGVHGFHVIRTIVIFDIDNGKITNLRVVELGKRADLAALKENLI